GAIVSEVVLKDRIHMANEGMFVVVLTVARGSGRLMTSPDIISRGFIYLRDSEELMGLIRQYLKQKVSRGFGKKFDIDQMKKEIKDEITHILYDQTRRTPIVIPVINEIGGSGNGGGQNRQSNEGRDNRDNRNPRSSGPRPQQSEAPIDEPLIVPEPIAFPIPQVPDTEAVEPRIRTDTRGY
ncbi:MAG: Beta-lactamase domain protein, partial [Candidatus Saccharibacteria bacterium]|nr:Beta-lactamase domain protein [Candidatus Saccharibacteria bacterium]